MNLIPKRSAFAITAVVLGLSLTVVVSQKQVTAQDLSGQKMEDAFKNIKAFRGLPADELLPTMVFFEAALGVGCPYCHDNDGAKRELDTKPQKLIARQMIDMVNAANKTTFNGAKRVTCFTCHMGRSTPVGVPNVIGGALPTAQGEDFIAALPPAPPVPAGVTPAQLFDKYLAAVGGAAAVQKTPSLVAAGTVTQRRPGKPFPAQQVEIASKPGVELITTKAGQNDNLLGYKGASAWAKAGNGAPRDLRFAEGDATRLEDTFNLPAQLKTLVLEPKVERPEVIDGREMYVLSGRTQYLPKVTAYFEKESGMLRRLVYQIDTFVGPYPTQIDYRDIRDVGGRMVPYSWVISQTRNREFTWAFQNISAAPVEDSKFVKPAAATAAR